MDSLPFNLFQREMGRKLNSELYDSKKLLIDLDSREEDIISLSVNSMTLNPPDQTNPIYDLEYCPNAQWIHILGAADEKGFLTLVNTRQGVKASQKIVERNRCHENALFSVAWNPLKLGVVATGSADQSVKIWDTSRGFVLIRKYKSHTRTVRAVRFHPSQSDILVSCSRDGSIMIWDARTEHSTPENVIAGAHACHTKKKPDELDSVTDVIFQDDNTLVSCGSTDGFIKFWDIRRTYKFLKRKDPVRQIPHPIKDSSRNGYCALRMDELHNLYAASANTEIFKFNLSTDSDKPESCFLNNSPMNFSIRIDISRDGRFLCAGSMNSTAHIWDTGDSTTQTPFTYLEGQSLDCTLGCAIFNPYDQLTIATGGDDSSLIVWRVNNLKARYKKASGIGGNDLPPKAPLDSLRHKQKHSLRSVVPVYRSAQISQVVGCAPMDTSTPDSNSSVFNFCSLLSGLPNFVIDGRMCHIPEQSFHTMPRKSTWLRDFAVTNKENKEKRSASLTLKATPPPKRAKRNSTTFSKKKLF